MSVPLVASPRALLSTLVVGAALASAAQACGSHQGAVAPGSTCEQATDCQEGYVCIQQSDGTRQCSNDLTSIQSTEESGAPMDAAVAMDTAAPTDGTAPQDVTMPVETGGPQETGTPMETGTPKETGSPQEAGPTDASGD